MSTSVDQRVVEMQFDNKRFQSRIKESVKSLDNLKNSLKLDNAAKGLTNINTQARRVSFSSMQAGIEKVAGRFNAMGAIGFTVLQDLTNSALRAGKRILSALTIDPVTSGLEEYEIKMNAIQTILTNTQAKGSTLEDINVALADLNDYADKTIYNFGQMTSNLGRFTAAGSSLEDSTIAIKGLSNVAAGFGVDATRMAGATFQMSEALAKGVVQLQDWKSLETAGMAGQMVQDAFRDTAESMGMVIDRGTAFRETLKDGWLTSEVFIETMRKMAEDKSLLEAATNVTTFTKLFDTMKESVQSGWAVSWEKIIGDKNESTKLLTSISAAFGEVAGSEADARNALLEFWSANGGREAVIEGIANALIGLSQVLKPIEQAFRDIFPPTTGEQLVKISEAFRDLMANFRISEATSEKLRASFRGLFAVVSIAGKVIGALAHGVGLLVKVLLPGTSGVLTITASIGDALTMFNNWLGSSNILIKSVDKLAQFIGFLALKIKTFGQESDFISNIITKFYEKLETLKWYFNKLSPSMETVNRLALKLKGSMEPVVVIFDAIKTKTAQVIDIIKIKVKSLMNRLTPVKEFFVSIKDKIQNAFSFEGLKNTPVDKLAWGGLAAFNVGVITSLFMGARKTLDTLSASLSGLFTEMQRIPSAVVGVLGSVKDTLEAYQNSLKADILMKLAKAIALLVVSIIALTFINPDKLKIAMAAIAGLFVELLGALKAFALITKSGNFDVIGKLLGSITILTGAIAILSISLYALSHLDIKQIASGLAGVAGLAVIVLGSLAILSKVSISPNTTKNLIITSAALNLFATALTLLSIPVLLLSRLDLKQLAAGVGAVGLLMTGLTLSMKYMKINSSSIADAFMLMGLAKAILKIADSVERLGKLDLKVLAKGLASVGVLLTELAIFAKVAGGAQARLTAGAIGVAIISGALFIYANAIERFDSIDNDKLQKGLLAIGASLLIVAGAMLLMPLNGLPSAAGFVLIAGGLHILYLAVEKFATLKYEEVKIALITIGIALVEIAVAMLFMQTALPGAAALVVISGALLMLAPALKTLGGLSWTQVIIGLTALAGLIALLAGASYLLTPIIPAMISLAGAIALLGGGIALFGGAVALFGTGVVLFSAGIASLVASGAAGVYAVSRMLEAVLDLVPVAVAKIGEGFVELIKVLGNAGVEVSKSTTKILIALLKGIEEGTPQLLEYLQSFATKMLEIMDKNTTTWMERGVSILLQFLKVIEEHSDEITDAGASAMAKLYLGMLNAMEKHSEEMAAKTMAFVYNFINTMAIIMEQSNPAIQKAMTRFLDAFFALMISTAKTLSKSMRKVGKNIIEGLVNGMTAEEKQTKEGMEKITRALKEAAEKDLETHSPSEFFARIGKYLMDGLGIGIDENGDTPKKAMEKQANDLKNTATKEYGEVGEKINEAIEKAYKADLEWIDEEKFYERLSLTDELAKRKEMLENYGALADKRKEINRAIYKNEKELLKKEAEDKEASYQHSMNWIEEEKYYKRLSLQGELDAFNRMLPRFEANSEQRKQIERDIYRVKNELSEQENESTKKKEDLKRAEYDNSIRWIESKKYYGELSLKEELAAWKRVQARYDKGAEELIKTDREIYRVKQELAKENEKFQKDILDTETSALEKRKQLQDEYYEKTKEINDKLRDDIAKTNEEYDNAVKSRTDSLYSLYSLFDPVKEAEAVTSEELKRNLFDQVTTFDLWAQNMKRLTERGLDEGFLEEIQSMGPKTNEQIKALLTMTDDELAEYVHLYKVKYKMARRQAELELVGLQKDTKTAIEGLKSAARIELDAYNDMWEGKMLELIRETNTSLDQLESDWLDTIDNIETESEKKLANLISGIQRNIENGDWTKTGQFIPKGVAEGINSKTSDVEKAANQLGGKASEALNGVLEIRSPSKVFMRSGSNMAEGLILGLRNGARSIFNTTKKIANGAQSALTTAIQSAMDMVGDDDYQPTITPVLDLSNIEAGKRILRSIFGLPSIGYSADLAGATGVSSGGGASNINNNINVAKLVVREEQDVNKVARKLYNMQISDRRG